MERTNGLRPHTTEGEWQTYKYDIGQLDLLETLDVFAAQLDEELQQ